MIGTIDEVYRYEVYRYTFFWYIEQDFFHSYVRMAPYRTTPNINIINIYLFIHYHCYLHFPLMQNIHLLR
jgi:hypothetical protein